MLAFLASRAKLAPLASLAERGLNPPTPSAVERVRTNLLCPSLYPAIPGRIHVLPSPFRLLTPAHPRRIHDLLKSQKSRKWSDFHKNGAPEALDERNPYSLMSRSHWEGSRALERRPGPQKWGRRHREAFKYLDDLVETTLFIKSELTRLGMKTTSLPAGQGCSQSCSCTCSYCCRCSCSSSCRNLPSG